MDYYKQALKEHKDLKGKLEVKSKIKVDSKDKLSTAYTPGVAAPCLEIKNNKNEVYTYTGKGNTIAIVTDGTAVLGLGDIGPEASLPVMEGKAVLFNEFANINAIPICLNTKDTDEIVQTVINISPTLGGINLEDISAPRCFEIEKKLIDSLNIPVFHDDQHGTAVVVTAALINALKLNGKKPEDLRVVINGAGAAGTAIARMLMDLGVKDLIVLNSRGILDPQDLTLDEDRVELAKITNPRNIKGGLSDAIKESDVFIGVSVKDVLSQEDIKSMNENPIIFAMANPDPEINPALAKEAGAFIVGTGRSDYENQINNVLAFPGIFRGALDSKAEKITPEMKIAAAKALADVLEPDELSVTTILPEPFDQRVTPAVSEAVAKAWSKNSK